MKRLIENYPENNFNPIEVLEYLFCGRNGIDMSSKGYIYRNYKGEEPYVFDKPVPLNYIYKWSDKEQFQQFRNYAGCRDVGFKEAAQYFIDCVMITPDHIENIKEWKQNIETVRSVLLDTPTITDPYNINEHQKFLSDIKNDDITANAPVGQPPSTNPENSVGKVWYFEAQWTDCPESVEAEVKELWEARELGNHHYIYKTELNEELFEDYPRIYFWLQHKGVKQGERVLISWWW